MKAQVVELVVGPVQTDTSKKPPEEWVEVTMTVTGRVNVRNELEMLRTARALGLTITSMGCIEWQRRRRAEQESESES